MKKTLTKRQKMTIIVIILMLLLFLILGCFFLYLNDRSNKKVLNPSGSTEEIVQRLNNVGNKNVHINFIPQITFEVGTKGNDGKIIFPNFEDNQLIMQCKLFVNNVQVANSGAIMPGKQITKLTLDRNIPKGEYKSQFTVEFYNLENEEYLNSSHYEVKVIVKV